MFAHAHTRDFLAQKNAIKNEKEGNLYKKNMSIKNNVYLCVALLNKKLSKKFINTKRYEKNFTFLCSCAYWRIE